jgi:hypothetical protein
MRILLALALAAPLGLGALSAQAGDAVLSCHGAAQLMSAQSRAPLDVKLTVQGGLEAPGAITYAWTRPEPSVPMTLKALSGDTLQFHGIAMEDDGAVLVADAQLNRATLGLLLKVRKVGGAAPEDILLEGACRRG